MVEPGDFVPATEISVYIEVTYGADIFRLAGTSWQKDQRHRYNPIRQPSEDGLSGKT
jgi:hypothetical protein